MESFVHLRKGRTPKRLHADLDGLKDDELGRDGFTGRTANIYRRHDPTAYRSAGPLRPIDVLSSELKPSDATDAHGGPLLLFSNADCQVSLSRRTEEMPFFVRYVDGDLLSFVHKGSGLLETEFGPLRYREGDWVYIPKACTWRQIPSGGQERSDSGAGPRNRIHLDVDVPPELAQSRIDAALAAGGTLRDAGAAPAFWVLADAEGNEVCICTWQGRD